jgi:four helix bundle protein|tara:strand:+ start:111 stop:497 length:387 start_codon:yes stop_codon:yes gene_type:complete
MSEIVTEKANIKTHKDLDVWKKSMDLVERVYRRTERFPDSEKYGLTNQIRRCAVSVSSNIAEGAARNTDKEFVQFCYIALGSLSELETQLLIAERLKYSQNIDILENVVEIRRMLLGLIKYLKSKQSK